MSLPQLLNTTAGRVTVGAEAVSLAAMAPFLLVEWSTFTAYSSERGGGGCWGTPSGAVARARGLHE
jgi:hypothetical protein